MCLDTEVPVRNFSGPLRILYLGRLAREQKRVQLFPEILKQLCASGMPFHWTVAGEGEARSFLEANMKPVPPTQTVSFTGPIRYADVPSVLKEHDICLLTSDYEGFGLGVAESMGYGLVPVVSDLPMPAFRKWWTKPLAFSWRWTMSPDTPGPSFICMNTGTNWRPNPPPPACALK